MEVDIIREFLVFISLVEKVRSIDLKHEIISFKELRFAITTRNNLTKIFCKLKRSSRLPEFDLANKSVDLITFA